MRYLYRERIFPASLLILIVSVTSLVGAQGPTARKPIKIDATQLQGVPNFRDIGGYKSADGHMIRYNMIYRSATLHDMTTADNAKLAPLKIRYEIDLRSPSERSLAPTNWGVNPPEVVDIPFLQDRPPMNLTDPSQAHAQIERFYETSAVLNAPTIGKVLHDLAQGDVPALIHCTGGVDRTGMTVAVLMTLLGASRKDVYREYLISSKLTNEQIQHLAANSGIRITPEFLKAVKIEASSLDTFFHSIDEHYGSFDQYVRKGLKLSSQDVQSLRQKLLVN